MKCDASNSVKNVVNSLKIIYHQHVQNVRRFIRPLVPASLPVWLSISIVYVLRRFYCHLLTCMPCMHAYPVAAKREFTSSQEEEKKMTAYRQAKIISRWPCVCIS
jgi:hypothetical protein